MSQRLKNDISVFGISQSWDINIFYQSKKYVLNKFKYVIRRDFLMFLYPSYLVNHKNILSVVSYGINKVTRDGYDEQKYN